MPRPNTPVNPATAQFLAAGYSIDREGAIISLLNTLHVMTKAQLEFFLFGQDLNPASRETVTRRALHRLREQKRITSFRFDGRDVWCLKTPRGVGLVNHDLLVVDVVAQFIRSVRNSGGILTHVETRVDVGDISPDAYLIVEHQEAEYHFFVELETGTSSGPRFREKVRRYERAYRKHAFADVSPIWPYVLVVTSTDGFEKRVRRYADTDSALQFFFTNLPLLQQQGPFAEIWTTAESDERAGLP